MNHKEKKRQLEALLRRDLLPLIDRKYFIAMTPHYTNVGDTLIWQGLLDLLGHSGKRCVGSSAYDDRNVRVPDGAAILIMGGGYFGDVWREAWENALDLIRSYPTNRIIILPQSIHYNDPAQADADAALMALCTDLTICVRDARSEQYARSHFSNPVVLMPDLAYGMSETLIDRYAAVTPTKQALYLKRTDPEYVENGYKADEGTDTADWATIDHPELIPEMFYRWVHRIRNRIPLLSDAMRHKAVQWYYRRKYRPIVLHAGLKQLSQYNNIHTTRLHTMILGCMLGREIHFTDNTTGKLSAYRDTWLTDCDNIHEN